MRRIALLMLVLAMGLGACSVEANPPRRRPAAAVGLGAPGRVGLEAYRMVDLTHVAGWTTLAGLAGATSGAQALAAATRVVAPPGEDVQAVGLEDLVAPAVVIDAPGGAVGPDYRLNVADVLLWEREHGKIQPGSIVLLRTGWSRFWTQRRRYLGLTDDHARGALPGYGADAIRLLLARHVVALGVDAPAVTGRDAATAVSRRRARAGRGRARSAAAEAGAAARAPAAEADTSQSGPSRGVVFLENLTNLATLPAEGALVVALPLKREYASTSPARIVALVPDRGR